MLIILYTPSNKKMKNSKGFEKARVEEMLNNIKVEGKLKAEDIQFFSELYLLIGKVRPMLYRFDETATYIPHIQKNIMNYVQKKKSDPIFVDIIRFVLGDVIPSYAPNDMDLLMEWIGITIPSKVTDTIVMSETRHFLTNIFPFYSDILDGNDPIRLAIGIRESLLESDLQILREKKIIRELFNWIIWSDVDMDSFREKTKKYGLSDNFFALGVLFALSIKTMQEEPNCKGRVIPYMIPESLWISEYIIDNMDENNVAKLSKEFGVKDQMKKIVIHILQFLQEKMN